MMFRKTPIGGWVGFALLLILLLASSTLAAETTTLTVWAMGDEGKLIRQMASRFEAIHPEVRIVTQSIPWSGAHEKLVTGVIGDMAPDICQLGTTWMSEFTAMDALEPLGDRIKTSSTLKSEDFIPGALSSCKFDGEWYGLPWYVDTRVFFYRGDMLEAVGRKAFPQTWDELSKVCEELVDARKKTGDLGFGFSLPTNDWQIFLMFYWQAGGRLLAGDRAADATRNTAQGMLMTEPGIKALEYMKGFFDRGLSPKDVGRDTDLMNAFESGFFPMFISGPWMISMLEQSKPGLSGKWSTSPLPRGLTGTSFIGGCNLVLFKSSKNKALAWKFLEFLSSSEIQGAWYEISKDLPAIRKAWDLPTLAQNPLLQAFKTQLDDVQAPPVLVEWEQVANAISQRMEEAVHGKISATQAVAAMNGEIKTILNTGTQDQSFLFKLGVTVTIIIHVMLLLGLYFRFAPKTRDVISQRKPVTIAWLFLSPALLILGIFLFIPILWSLVASCTNWNIYGIAHPSRVNFVGLENYRRLLTDPIFWISLRNTLVFAIFGVPLNIILALGMALVLNRGFIRMKALFRIGFFIPVITTMVAVAVIWRWLYNPEFGLLNMALTWIGVGPQSWLADEWLALPCLIVMAVWKGFGYNMIIFNAALQAIPETLYEAADIDGASHGQQFWYITLPMLRRTTVFVALMTSIGFLQFFAEPYIMTGGGPLNRTMSVVLYLYQHGFKFYNLGYASSIAYALFALILGFSLIQGRIQKFFGGADA